LGLCVRVRDNGMRAGCSANGERGYAMVVLLVSLSIMTVMMSVAMPVWKQMVQREKEAELVFRGEQYARAIGLFQRKNGPGTLPPSIDVLVEQRYLRKKYKDPITNDDFAPILMSASTGAGQSSSRQETDGFQTGRGAPQAGAGRATGAGTGAGRATGAGTGAGATAGAGFGSQTSAQQQGRGGQLGIGTGTAFGGVSGVTSKSKDRSIRIYKGRNRYNEWQFVYTAPQIAGGGGPNAPNAPGTGGQRGRGQGPANPQGGVPMPPGFRGAPGDGRGGGGQTTPDGPMNTFPPFGPNVPNAPRGGGPPGR
jgi:type II secretory pathway pseudopilin PulG